MKLMTQDLVNEETSFPQKKHILKLLMGNPMKQKLFYHVCEISGAKHESVCQWNRICVCTYLFVKV